MICPRQQLRAQIVCASDKCIALHLANHPIRHLLTHLSQTLLDRILPRYSLTLVRPILPIQ